MSKYLINISGPTAIGKTALAIQVARHFHTEIISSDSRQFYKEMNIGTAVPSAEELNAATHHFIQFLSVDENYSVFAIIFSNANFSFCSKYITFCTINYLFFFKL